MPLPARLRKKGEHFRKPAVWAPGASEVAVYASYGIEPRKQADWTKVRKICKGITEGLSVSAACGRANTTPDVLKDWETHFPAVYEATAIAKLKRLALLEEGLLKDDAKMPQVIARIFALKNADPENWQENPGKEGAGTGLQQNITIITGVPEAPQAHKVIEHVGPPLEQSD